MKKIILLSILVMSVFVEKAQCQSGDPVKIPTYKKFYVQSAINYNKNIGGFWDFPGSPTSISNSMELIVWDLDDGEDRKFMFAHANIYGYYNIITMTKNKAIDVTGGNGNIAKNGNSISSWDRHSNISQMFTFRHLGGGRFKIYTKAGHVLNTDGRTSANGTKVTIWEDHDGAWMEFYLIDAETKEAYIPQ